MPSTSEGLKPSLREALEAFPQFDFEWAAAGHIGAVVACSLRAARRRLDELEALGLVERIGRKTPGGSSLYALTDAGKDALSNSEEPNEQ